MQGCETYLAQQVRLCGNKRIVGALGGRKQVHGHQGQHFGQMILHDVPHHAVAVVEASAAPKRRQMFKLTCETENGNKLTTDSLAVFRFQHRNFNVFDTVGVQQFFIFGICVAGA